MKVFQKAILSIYIVKYEEEEKITYHENYTNSINFSDIARNPSKNTYIKITSI